MQRTAVLEDSQSASKAAITKRRNLERLKASSNINPAKVDDAISEMQEVSLYKDHRTGHSKLICNSW